MYKKTLDLKGSNRLSDLQNGLRFGRPSMPHYPLSDSKFKADTKRLRRAFDFHQLAEKHDLLGLLVDSGNDSTVRAFLAEISKVILCTSHVA